MAGRCAGTDNDAPACQALLALAALHRTHLAGVSWPKSRQHLWRQLRQHGLSRSASKACSAGTESLAESLPQTTTYPPVRRCWLWLPSTERTSQARHPKLPATAAARDVETQ